MIDYFEPPSDGFAGAWVGRAWTPGAGGGPVVITVRPEGVFDITADVATMSALCDLPDPAAHVRGLAGRRLCDLDELLANSCVDRRDDRTPWLLAPVDLQAIKAAGVTFAPA
jgi:fumarylacetoacetate (FAA) hydrolase family protein